MVKSLNWSLIEIRSFQTEPAQEDMQSLSPYQILTKISLLYP